MGTFPSEHDSLIFPVFSKQASSVALHSLLFPNGRATQETQLHVPREGLAKDILHELIEDLWTPLFCEKEVIEIGPWREAGAAALCTVEAFWKLNEGELKGV